METVRDFEDILQLFERFEVRYLVIGGLAFTFHAKPRYTKDIELWLDPVPENVERTNRALAAFGSPYLLNANASGEILQLGVAPKTASTCCATLADRAGSFSRMRGEAGSRLATARHARSGSILTV